MEHHETHHQVEMGSNRNFGLVFAAMFAIIGVLPLLSTPSHIKWWPLGLSALFLAAAIIRPGILQPLNRAWFLLGLALGRVVAPLVMVVVYYLAVVPTGLLLRLFSKDLLHLRRPAASSPSFWKERNSEEAKMGSMKNQF